MASITSFEIKIPHEIRDYYEAVWMGLSLKQCAFVAAGAATSGVLFFLLSPYMGVEARSWICVLAAAPWGALAFVKWQGLTASQALKAILLYLRTPKQLAHKPTNTIYTMMREVSQIETPTVAKRGGKTDAVEAVREEAKQADDTKDGAGGSAD